AACATTTAPLPPLSTAPQQSIDYLKTLGGGWRIRLTDDHRAATACQYGLTVGPARPFTKTLYLPAEFENPPSPFVAAHHGHQDRALDARALDSLTGGAR